MLLSYNKLVQLVNENVISADPANINGASIDLTLDSTIMVEAHPELLNMIDVKGKQVLNMVETPIPESGYILRPGEFILASTREYFNLPNTIAAEYKLKSSLARVGLSHLLAGWADPGWSNSKLTLEFHNVSKFHNLILKPGMKCGQMVFWECEPVPDEANYSNVGQYNGQDKVTNSKGTR